MISVWNIALTHWGWDKITVILKTTHWNAFSGMEMFEFWLKFHYSLFLRGPINDILALVQIMDWHRIGNKPLSEPMMVRLLMYTSMTASMSQLLFTIRLDSKLSCSNEISRFLWIFFSYFKNKKFGSRHGQGQFEWGHFIMFTSIHIYDTNIINP